MQIETEQLSQLKQRLLERYNHLRRDLYHELRKIGREEDFKDLAGEVHDIGEVSVADGIFETDIELIDVQARELRRVEEALVRMAQGHYGECIDCGQAIPAERLLAEPEAARCLACQQRFEREHPAH